MYETATMLEKWKLMLRITFPILVTQVAMYLITFFDINMSSRYGTTDLAGVSVGSSFWMPVYIGLAGILIAITPIVAHLIGASKRHEVKEAVQQGLYLSILLAAVVFALFFFGADPVLAQLSLEPAVREVASEYIFAMSLGLFPLFAYNTLRYFVEALGSTRVTMFITLLSAPINVLFNYLLIFGAFGFPELGGAGAGYASTITYWLIFVIIFLLIKNKKPFSSFQLFSDWQRLSFPRWIEISRIGVPIGISIFAETSIFSAVTLMISAYGTIVVSAHQIAINFTSLLYMLPLSISMGATILVGFEVGAGRLRHAKQYSWLAVGTAVVFSFVSAAVLYSFREQIALLYTEDEAVIRLAVQFFLFAALFQLSDAIQAPVQGALRGYKDVNVTFIMAVVSYWVIGLPAGYLMARYSDLGPFGYWVGLISGLTAGAVTLSLRLYLLQKKKKDGLLK